MTHLKIGVMLSLGVHLLLFFYAAPFLGVNLPVSPIRDYHLPIAVELVQTEQPAEKLPPMPLIPPAAIPLETKKAVSHPDDLISKPSASTQLTPIHPRQARAVAVSKGTSNKSSAKAATLSSKAWNMPPIYPEAARRLGQEGRVILDAELDHTGKVILVRVSRSSGYPELDQAALQAVSQWKMDLSPNGSRRLFIPVTFKLQSEF